MMANLDTLKAVLVPKLTLKYYRDIANAMAFNSAFARRFLLKTRLSPSKRVSFVSSKKLFLFLKNLIFFPDFFGQVGKRLAKVNFRIYDIINWKANNCNTHTVRYLKKQRQADNEIWSVNKIQ